MFVKGIHFIRNKFTSNSVSTYIHIFNVCTLYKNKYMKLFSIALNVYNKGSTELVLGWYRSMSV